MYMHPGHNQLRQFGNPLEQPLGKGRGSAPTTGWQLYRHSSDNKPPHGEKVASSEARDYFVLIKAANFVKAGAITS